MLALQTDYNASGIASKVYRLLDTQPSLLLEKLLHMVLYKLLELVPSTEEVCSFSTAKVTKSFFNSPLFIRKWFKAPLHLFLMT
jgi:hypothetical protein